MRQLVIIPVLFALGACGQAPEETVPEQAQADILSQKELNEKAKSIEDAADQAVKLIEAEAKSEVDASNAK